jgi:aryl-alcohol dehydrogenase-like predicted oxidoreductase
VRADPVGIGTSTAPLRGPTRLGLLLTGRAAEELGAPGPGGRSISEGELRLADALGIRAFEVPAHRSRAAIESALGRLFPPGSAGAGPFRTGSLPSEALRSPPATWAEELERSRHRLGGAGYDVVWFRVDHLERPGALAALSDRELLGAWGCALPPGPSAIPELERALATGAGWFRLPYNLLEPAPGEECLARIARGGGRAIVVDPFAGGRLDGSWLERAGRPSSGPWRPDREAREMAPVLALGFLTEGKTRTLAQAALAFALRAPAVASVMFEAGAPERLREYAATPDRGPLAPADLERLARLASGSEGRS